MLSDSILDEGYPCDCGGSITKVGDSWCCDSCDFIFIKSQESIKKNKEGE